MISSENEWESDDEEEYFRLKVDNLTKIKQQLNKFIKMKTKKVKKINNEDHEELKKYFNYLNNDIYPYVVVNEDKISSIKLRDEEYNVIQKPEIGSSMIFELNKSSVSYVGTAKDYFEATTKILKRTKIKSEDDEIEIKKPIKKRRPKIIKTKNSNKTTQQENKIRKKRRKLNHKKNSTIKEIKKIEK
jgi:hypothetical protein